MKYFSLAIIIAAVSAVSGQAASVVVTGQTAGPTPFIAQLQMTASPPTSVKSIEFQIMPKPGSVTRPVAATYPIEYLTKRGYFNAQTGAILLPVFGLYSNYSNTVNLTYTFTDNSSQPDSVMITTPVFDDSCGYNSPIPLQPRTNSTALSYDYILIKAICGNASPVIIDTDGQVRWIGTAAVFNQCSTLFQNSVYIADSHVIYRIELDGTFVALHDFSSEGVVDFHHNADFGKRGIIFEIDTPSLQESVDIEIDGLGNLLKTWNLADIISAAMIAGGDGDRVGEFVDTSTDWFHNNSVTYKSSDDSLLVSSRENFVVALDYDSGTIKWILGDTSKQWGLYPSLTNYALNLDANTLPPIGEHALSITKDDNLLLFDNGKASLNHSPPGMDRGYSAPRKYQINAQTKVATELWNYTVNQTVNSPFCSSVYEDSPLNYLVDYAFLGQPVMFAEILGLDSAENKIFHYRYSTVQCDTAWNSMPVHLEAITFSVLPEPVAVSRKSHGAAGSFDVPLPLSGNPGVECRLAGPKGDYQVVATFPTVVTVTTASVTAGSGGTATVSGSPEVSGNQVTVNLTNVSNAQTISLNLIGVSDGLTTDNVSIPMGVLIGDTTGNGVVNASDISQVKAQSGAPVSASNFRSDLTANGSINSGDVSLAKVSSGSALSAQK